MDLKACSLTHGPGTVVLLEEDEQRMRLMAMTIWQEADTFPCTTTKVDEAMALVDHDRALVLAVVVSFEMEGVGALLELVAQKGVPVVLYGEDFTDAHRKRLTTISIADVVAGDLHVQVRDVAQCVARLYANQGTKILVVDDSRSMRSALSRFLTTRCFKVREAADGLEALEKLKAEPEIKLVITDNEMPGMDGFTLVREIRREYSKDDLAVIGISAKTNSMLSVKFITNGANDFLHKPFVKEELYCRVDHNLDMVRRIGIIRDLSNKDPLTRLFNRRYLFDTCDEFMASQGTGKKVVLGMFDIDHFKVVNDTHGHDVGDEVIQYVAGVLWDAYGDHGIVTRIGGEEFCVLMAVDEGGDVFAAFDQARRRIEQEPVKADETTVSVTVSIGVATEERSIHEMIKTADTRLYQAKESGRNRVVLT